MQETQLDEVKVTWVTRSFLDYRVPVFAELDSLLGHRLNVIYSKKWTPQRVQRKVESVLGSRAIGLTGEMQIGSDGRANFANSTVCVPYQPGLLRAIRQTRPELLVGDGFFRWTPAALAYKAMFRTPLVLCYEKTFHTERRAQRFRTMYRKAVVRRTEAMCCNGQLCVDYATSLGMPRERITTGHMAADTCKLQQSADRITDPQRDELRRQLDVVGLCHLYVGRIIPLKGIQQLLNAWQTVEDVTVPSTLVLVGDGPERKRLERRSQTLGINSVRFVGSVDYEQIAPYFAMADIFVMPTLEDNWSLVVPEAMACGLPILCSKYNGCWPELVHEGQNGWVFDPLDEDDFANVLRRAAGNRGRVDAMGQRSREIVADFSPAHAARSIFEACQIALARHRQPQFV